MDRVGAGDGVGAGDAVEAVLSRGGRIARRRDLLAAGLTRRELQRRVRGGELRPLTPHLVTDVAQPSPDEPLREAAVALGAVVGHTSAALLWGLELARTPAESTVTVGRDRSRARLADVRVRRSDLASDEVHGRDGAGDDGPAHIRGPVPGPAAGRGVAAADSALQRGLMTLADLRAALCRLPAGRGRALVARVVALVDPCCTSGEHVVACVRAALDVDPTWTGATRS